MNVVGRITTLAAACALAATLPSAGFSSFTDVNPNNSDLDSGCPANGPSFCPDPDGASGGRTNGLATVPGNNQTFYAATEWGGIYKSTNGGLNWAYLPNHIPQATWDVQVDPSNANRVYATSFFDGRATTLAGINVSTNGGSTWTHPPQAFPANSGTYSCSATDRAEPSFFGIAIEPGATNNVYVGTNCGLAISSDSGNTWTVVDPDRLTSPVGSGNATIVWDVVAQTGGTIDVCGNEGHFRSTTRGVSWTQGTGLPSGPCSIAASPDEAYVLLAAGPDSNYYETDDADAAAPTWTNRGTPDSTRQGRFQFVATNQRANTGGGANVFDLWFGDVRLFSASCTTPATRPSPDTGGSPRCPAARTGAPASPPPAGWNGPFTRTAGAHDDAGEIVFDSQAATDACPDLFSSDGGVYYNTDNGADCQNPNWEQPTVSPHALWLFAMAGANQAGDANEDLYIGMQDTGFFVTTNAGAATPTWSNKDCCDIFNIVADSTRVVWDICCGYTMRTGGNGVSSRANVATVPPGTLSLFRFPDFLDSWTPGSYIGVSSTGGYTTTNITASPVTWTQLGSASTPVGGFCGVQTAVAGGTPTFYAQTTCIGGPGSAPETQGSSQLWTYQGTGTGGTWTRIDNNGLAGGLGIFAVDPNDPNRLYASNLSGIAGVRMVFSTDGGLNWQFDPELDSMMTGNGTFLYQTQQGPTNFSTFNGYEQPTLVAYDPEDSDIMVAGGRDSGVFLSTNGGADWSLLTDQANPSASGKKLLTHPFFAYFDHEPASRVNIYIGTRGHGVWRISLGIPTVSLADETTDEGQDVTLTATANDPDGQPLTYAWSFDGDGVFDDGANSATVNFDRVGQDGVYPVSVKVTDPDGAFSVATANVTVNNVAPTVTVDSDAPKPENSAVTVSGKVSDPGWLDPLTATIDWDDGTPVANISGTLENVRPDATLTFSVSHTYGDNGTFDAEVCGSDDDTTTCTNISLTITNVDPTAVIDETNTVLINGMPTFIAHAGETIDFSGRSQDPGSDDLTLTWDWDDGPPAPDESTTYLNDPVNFPAGDPFPSPTINPRDVTDTKSHAFADACFYEIVFGARDDDGGTGSDTAKVIITGNADATRSAGFWQNQYVLGRATMFPPATLMCYLEIIGYMSLVFDEVVDASTFAKAYAILSAGGSADAKTQLDRQLLAAWLNFANGSLDLDELVDTDGKKGLDTTFYAAVMAAETVRLNPASTRAELLAQKDILERINLRDE